MIMIYRALLLYLLHKGAGPNIANKHNLTPLNLAISLVGPIAVEALLQHRYIDIHQKGIF